jgi:hypothetical protein
VNPLLAGAAGAGAVIGLLAGLVLSGRARRKAQTERDEALGELQALRSKPGKQEFRLERFELLWFPVVTFSEKDRSILSAAPGVPHCRACLIPLALNHESWDCRQCGGRHAASLADTAVTDAIVNEALRFFSERHPGYSIPRK